jgi:hypothetical protein
MTVGFLGASFLRLTFFISGHTGEAGMALDRGRLVAGDRCELYSPYL